MQFGQYEWDDERIWSAAATAVAQHELPHQGIASTIGVPNGPFQVLFMMPFAAVTHAPLAGAVFVALLNIVAVYFVFRFVDEFFGRRPALIAAALFAVNSWAVIYSRHVIVQGMMIPFQVLFFWNLARWLARGRGLDLILSFLWLAVLSQVYLDGLLQAATLALALALGWRNLRPWPLLAGGVLCGLLLLPYTLDAVLPNLAWFRSVSTGAPTVDAQSVGLALYQASHEGFELNARQMEAWPYTTAGAQSWLQLLEESLFAAGALYAIVRLIRLGRRGQAPEARVYALLLLWLLVPIAVYLRHSEVLSWRHFALLIPLPAIFSAFVLDWLWPAFGAPAVGLLGANSLSLAWIYLAAAPTCITNNVYGLPYQSTFDAARSLEQLATANHAARVYVDGDPALAPILTSVLSRDGFDAIWSDPEHGPELGVMPGSASVYATFSEDTDSARLLKSALGNRQVATRPLPCVGMTMRTYALTPSELSSVIAGQPTWQLRLRGENGLGLESALLDRRLHPGQPLRVGVSWRWPGGARPSSDYWLFGHLLDANGQVVGQQDVPLRPTAGWVQDEMVLTWLDVPVPPATAPGRYVLELGMYDSRGARTNLADDAAKPAGSSVVIQPLVVPPRPAALPAALASANTRFGDEIELTGVRAEPSGEVSFVWRALSQPARDYTVFVHALDASGTVVAQADGEPDGGGFPTAVWQPGETVLDTHQLRLAPGQYKVEVGLYYVPTLERLPGGPFAFELTAQ